MIYGIAVEDYLFMAALLGMLILTSSDAARRRVPWLHWVFSACGIVSGILLLTGPASLATKIYAGAIMLSIALVEAKPLFSKEPYAKKN
jgi:hypothetical protein